MLLSLGTIFLAISSVSHAGFIIKEHSLLPPYIAGGDNLLPWDFTGSAEPTGTFIRLTPDEKDKQGAIWNNYPCFSNNWELQIQFHIHGKGVYLNGDGIAIWYVQESDVLHGGPVFGSKDYFTGLGVFIDTFANQAEPEKRRHPYISAMVNNGSLHYESSEDGAMTHIGGCHAIVRNLKIPTRVAVSYINKTLSVYIDNEGVGQWRLCFASAGVHLPTGYNFGISAGTSDASHTDNHDILVVTALNMDADNSEWEDRGDVVPHIDNVEIPQKYHKEFIEEEQQKIEKKREVKEEEVDNDVITDEEVEDDIAEDDIETDDTDESDTATDDASPPTSLIRKLVYLTGAIALILVSISAFKKYSERRRIRIEKRLY